jgi:predicted metal-binding protein
MSTTSTMGPPKSGEQVVRAAMEVLAAAGIEFRVVATCPVADCPECRHHTDVASAA